MAVNNLTANKHVRNYTLYEKKRLTLSLSIIFAKY